MSVEIQLLNDGEGLLYVYRRSSAGVIVPEVGGAGA